MERRKVYPCRDCQGPCWKAGARCLTCHWDHRDRTAKGRMCNKCEACGGPCSRSATRCLGCAPVHLEGRKASEAEREKMRAAARRRCAHIQERRLRAAALWQAGQTLVEISRAVGVTADCVAEDLERVGVRQRKRNRRLTAADFEAMIQREPSGCWTWGGPTSRRNPNGLAMLDGERLGARQVAWYRVHGHLPTVTLLPTCGTQRCINPDHQRQRAVVDQDLARLILEAAERGERQDRIAARFGCRRETVCRLISRHRAAGGTA